MERIDEPAIVVFSGGQDSTTCLVWALKKFSKVSAITFNYNQRHSIEIECAKNIVELINQKKMAIDGLLKEPQINHNIIDLTFLSKTLNTAMIQDNDIKYDEESGLPTTFVPGRNILFLTIAAALAYQKKIKYLVAGMGQTDYSGYPDCRNDTIQSLQKTLELGLDYEIIIWTPLMWKSKAETIELMKRLGGTDLYKYTHTCYKGQRPACGKCFACELRLEGFKEAGLKDPLEYEIK